MPIKWKVCGMKFPDNVAEISQLKPDYVGFIFYPKSKRFVEDLSPEIVSSVGNLGIKTTGVFVNERMDILQQNIQKYAFNAIQLHGNESPEYLEILNHYRKKSKHKFEIIKAFGLDNTFDFNQLIPYNSVCDYFLFDSKTSEYGGSGETFNWRILKNYTLDKQFFLSGGITLNNIDAIIGLKEKSNLIYAVDVNSKFEIEPAKKDSTLLKELVKKLKTK